MEKSWEFVELERISNETDDYALKSIIQCLLGSMIVGDVTGMAVHCSEYAQMMIKKLNKYNST